MLNASWQRCRVHFMRNAMAHAGKTQRRIVSAWIGTAFAQDDADAASKQWRNVADQLRPRVPKLAALMDDAEADVLAFTTFPKEHRGKIHSTDALDKRDLAAVPSAPPECYRACTAVLSLGDRSRFGFVFSDHALTNRL